ncbi:hypothetical protein EYF80_024843 [Liparis tanakae]|uniref:Uncharacterized protein n=1 Tax=Liparis tanakae TaxID=230148 RepID=A0A4Z2HGG4_9TELE|nr:hypothetical protein EYF80_024843 [Liparis tanakae]
MASVTPRQLRNARTEERIALAVCGRSPNQRRPGGRRCASSSDRNVLSHILGGHRCHNSVGGHRAPRGDQRDAGRRPDRKRHTHTHSTINAGQKKRMTRRHSSARRSGGPPCLAVWHLHAR